MIIELTFTTTIFLVFALFYYLVLIAVIIGLRRLKFSESGEIKKVSVVIAARNEAERIGPCLKSLEKLDYPPDKYEIIFVDDCSEDDTAKLIDSFCKDHQNRKLIRITELNGELHGKKNALLNGISHANGEIIFTTDADCVVPPRWIRKMVNYFKPGISMVLGYSPLEKGKGFFRKILEFDNLFSAIAASAPTKLGYPFTSVGRNLAYRKDAYENAGGFLALKQFRSGDDVHLTERFRLLDNGRIDFCADPDTFVLTRPPSTAKEIFHQQIRKNSKALKKTWSSVLFSVILFVFYMLLIFLPLILPEMLAVWALVMLFKFILEYADLSFAAKLFRQNGIIPYIPVMQVIFPFYIIFFSLLGIFQVYRWKR